jgi:hypothetical protein
MPPRGHEEGALVRDTATIRFGSPAASSRAKSVPFTATLDSSGRLTEFKIDGSGIDPGFPWT